MAEADKLNAQVQARYHELTGERGKSLANDSAEAFPPGIIECSGSPVDSVIIEVL